MMTDEKRYAIGVDVGGSHISCTTYDLIQSKLVAGTTRSLPIDNKGSKENIINRFAELLTPSINNITSSELAGIGIAMPGPIDYESGLGLFSGDNAKYVNLCQVNIREELSSALNIDEQVIRFINDATAFALGEFFNGQLIGSKRSLAITLGTGFGAAFLSNGIPVLADEKVPKGGCLWYLSFENGIADDYFSTRGLVDRFEAKSNLNVKGVKEIAEKVVENAHAQAVFDDFGDKLASFLLPWLKSFEVENVVIGGNISKAFKHFENSLKRYIQTKGMNVKIEQSELLENSAFIGAAALLNDEFYTSIKKQLKYM